MPVRPSLLTVLVPALVFAGDSLPQIAPTPAKPPKATADTFYLVDKVIPAYGMRYLPYEHADRALALVNDIKAFVAEVDSKTMEGSLHRAPPPPPSDHKAKDKDKPAPLAMPGVRTPLPEEVTLNDLLGRLVVLEQRLKASRPAELPIPEQWTIDGALSDLHRAADLLRLGLNDGTYTSLEAQQRAWLQAYLGWAVQAREQKIAQMMAANKKLSRKDVEAQLEKTGWKPSYPEAGQVVTAPGAVPAPAAPAAKPEAKPAAPPEAKPAEPAVPPEAKPAAPPEAKPAEPAAPPEAKPAEPAAPPEAKPAEPEAKPAAPPEAKPAEPAAPPEAKPAEPAAPPEAKPAEPKPADGKLPDL